MADNTDGHAICVIIGSVWLITDGHAICMIGSVWLITEMAMQKCVVAQPRTVVVRCGSQQGVW